MTVTPEMITQALELILIPLFLWMDRRISRAQSDAQNARSKAAIAFDIAKDTQSQLAEVRSEQSKLTTDVLTRMESINVTIARIDGRFQSFLEFEKERRV